MAIGRGPGTNPSAAPHRRRCFAQGQHGGRLGSLPRHTMVATSPAAPLRLLVLSLAASAALHAQTTTEVEPNNTVATAQLIQFGQQVQANLGAGDEDWFFFTLTKIGRAHV